MSLRESVIRSIAEEICGLRSRGIFRVAIDGVDGSGKTCFADELAEYMDVETIRASVDSFHNPRSVRHRQGRNSPDGFFRNSFNYPVLKRILLGPLSTDPPSTYCAAYYDHRVDSEVELEWKEPPTEGVLVFDGIFSHRSELIEYWDYSIFLEVSTETSVQRRVDRDDANADLNHPSHLRYVLGQKIYLDTCNPRSKCTKLIYNEDLERPSIAI